MVATRMRVAKTRRIGNSRSNCFDLLLVTLFQLMKTPLIDSNQREREERSAKLAAIMSRIRTPTTPTSTPQPAATANGHANMETPKHVTDGGGRRVGINMAPTQVGPGVSPLKLLENSTVLQVFVAQNNHADVAAYDGISLADELAATAGSTPYRQSGYNTPQSADRIGLANGGAAVVTSGDDMSTYFTPDLTEL